MLFTYIFLAVIFSVVVLLGSLWLIESEEDHDEEVALHDHLETEKESIEFAEYALGETRSTARRKK